MIHAVQAIILNFCLICGGFKTKRQDKPQRKLDRAVLESEIASPRGEACNYATLIIVEIVFASNECASHATNSLVASWVS